MTDRILQIRNMKKKIQNIAVVIFMICMIFASYKIYRINRDYNKSNQSYSELEQFVEMPESKHIENEDTEETTTAKVTETILFPTVNFDDLSVINSDIVGWLYFDNTTINYPIVQGEDNSYYLKHLFDKNYSSSGCIFLDCNNSFDFSDYNNVIYGHHMKNGTMFSSLTEYKNQDYYDAHPQAILVTPNQNYIIDIFAGYVASTNDNAWQITFETDNEFIEWIADIQERSCFASNVKPVTTDRIITFSTCSYEFDNARFILHGILKSKRQN